MFKPYDYINAIYNKTYAIRYAVDVWACTYLNKTLIQDKNNAEALRKAIEYCFYISDLHYYYLLWCLIPQSTNVYLDRASKPDEDTADPLIDKLIYVLGWSRKEYELNKSIINKVIIPNKEYWESELGIQKKKTRKKKDA